MIITLELPPAVEAKLREGAAKHDAEAVRRVLTEAVAPVVDATVAAFLQDPTRTPVRRADGLADMEFDRGYHHVRWSTAENLSERSKVSRRCVR